MTIFCFSIKLFSDWPRYSLSVLLYNASSDCQQNGGRLFAFVKFYQCRWRRFDEKSYCWKEIEILLTDLATYVQDWTQVLFGWNFIYGWVIWHFHTSSYKTELCAFWWKCFSEDTLWRLLWGACISLAVNPGHIWIWHATEPVIGSSVMGHCGQLTFCTSRNWRQITSERFLANNSILTVWKKRRSYFYILRCLSIKFTRCKQFVGNLFGNIWHLIFHANTFSYRGLRFFSLSQARVTLFLLVFKELQFHHHSFITSNLFAYFTNWNKLKTEKQNAKQPIESSFWSS